MTDQPYVFLAGASRGVGFDLARWLLGRGHLTKTLLRLPPNTDGEASPALAELETLGAKIAIGDALDAEAVHRAMQADPVWAVVSTIGGISKDGQRADFLGNKVLIDAAIAAEVKKFVLISSIGAGESAIALPPQVLQTLGPVLAEKEQAEQYLIASGLTYIVVRPGGLKSEPPTGNAVLTPDVAIAGSIHRADVADLVGRCLFSSQADNRILSAVDRGMLYGEPEFEVLLLDTEQA
ncbi:MAG: SDR family oxidoreductase [Cyanobacteria bacterium J069]|nr:MAG: SDR family oxidoreductase [Cyanobacteria bacterium J069]